MAIFFRVICFMKNYTCLECLSPTYTLKSVCWLATHNFDTKRAFQLKFLMPLSYKCSLLLNSAHVYNLRNFIFIKKTNIFLYLMIHVLIVITLRTSTILNTCISFGFCFTYVFFKKMFLVLSKMSITIEMSFYSIF